MEKKKIYLTPEGLEEKKQELSYLIQVKKPEIIETLKEARSYGDLSENAEYDAARSEQAMIESQIAELEHVISNAEIITDPKGDEVSLGTTVTLKYVDDEEFEEYKIVGSQEADPFKNRISNESPIAKAILGAKKGDVVEVESPNGKYQVEITGIC